ncbi:hypothetical protein SAY86_013213 [Trapa natans]|uniref:Embryo defective 2759 protein n=1 Tax=Trapa natans TaxID=22666 RepID=A0AAN7LZ60_TRANT|nr:hypothetical protein SAY86_013213 [Trapa natans]
MALQGTPVAFPSKYILKSNKELRLSHCVIKSPAFGDFSRYWGLKRYRCFRVGPPRFYFPKLRSLRVSSFKEIAQNDGSGGGRSGETCNNSVKVTYVSKESEETTTESSNGCDMSISHVSRANGEASGSAAIHKLFRKWLTMLTMQSSDQAVDEILEERSPPKEISGSPNEAQLEGKNGALKRLWGHFWALDATIKFPLLIFVPFYLSVNVTYGREVSKELMPLWVFGPLVIAFYIKMLRGLCSLYVFTFKQTINVAINLPVFYMLAYEYVAQGKLKEAFLTRVCQPMVYIKNLDYKVYSRRKLQELQNWLLEMYLDFVESIWPYYCRTIRFLKRANLI